MQQVVAADLQLEPISATCKLPNTCDKKAATKHKAERVRNQDHDMIMDELERRDRLEHEEDLSDEEESEHGEESDDGSQAEDE